MLHVTAEAAKDYLRSGGNTSKAHDLTSRSFNPTNQQSLHILLIGANYSSELYFASVCPF